MCTFVVGLYFVWLLSFSHNVWYHCCYHWQHERVTYLLWGFSSRFSATYVFSS